jgi:hypothetical protein
MSDSDSDSDSEDEVVSIGSFIGGDYADNYADDYANDYANSAFKGGYVDDDSDDDDYANYDFKGGAGTDSDDDYTDNDTDSEDDTFEPVTTVVVQYVPKDNDDLLANFYTGFIDEPTYIEAECIYDTTRPYAFIANNYIKSSGDFSDSQYENAFDADLLGMSNSGTDFKRPNDLSYSSNVTVGIHDYFCGGPFFFMDMSQPGILTFVQVSHAYDAPNIQSKARRIVPSNFMIIKAYKNWIVIVTVCKNNDFANTTGSKILINKIIGELKEYNKTVKNSAQFTHVVLESTPTNFDYWEGKMGFTEADNRSNPKLGDIKIACDSLNNENFFLYKSLVAETVSNQGLASAARAASAAAQGPLSPADAAAAKDIADARNEINKNDDDFDTANKAAKAAKKVNAKNGETAKKAVFDMWREYDKIAASEASAASKTKQNIQNLNLSPPGSNLIMPYPAGSLEDVKSKIEKELGNIYTTGESCTAYINAAANALGISDYRGTTAGQGMRVLAEIQKIKDSYEPGISIKTFTEDTQNNDTTKFGWALKLFKFYAEPKNVMSTKITSTGASSSIGAAASSSIQSTGAATGAATT